MVKTTNIDYRKIDYDQLIDKPINRVASNVDMNTLTTAWVYDKGDGKRIIVAVDGNNITQTIEEKNGYQERTSSNWWFTRSTWDVVVFNNDTSEKWDKVIISQNEPDNPVETTAWLNITDDSFNIYDGTEWHTIAGWGTTEVPYIPTFSGVMNGTTTTFTNNNIEAGDGIILVSTTSGHPAGIWESNVDVWGFTITSTESEDNVAFKYLVVKSHGIAVIEQANEIEYDNTESGLTATNVQDAIDELAPKTVEINDYSAVQWPCENGFHIPSQWELSDLKSIMDGLSLSTWNSYKTKLHMPFVWYRRYTDATILNNGTSGSYWSVSPHWNANLNHAKYLSLTSSDVWVNSSDNRSNAFSLRAFKDTYVEPDNTWTVVEGSLDSAGIFHNTTLWLISVTNGTDKSITMKDKNEWATVVYNIWDILTEDNQWKLFQRWNNYWFNSKWTITKTSVETVDTSSYAPSTYSSDTFIIWSNDWSSPHNDNLWWAVTWIIHIENKWYLAEDIIYDNSESGLTSVNVQDAIDEIGTDITNINTSIENVQNDIIEIKNITEVTTMDEPTIEDKGSIIQYKWETTEEFKQGYFYKCVEIPWSDPKEYKWINIPVQDWSWTSEENIIYLTEEEYEDVPEEEKLNINNNYVVYGDEEHDYINALSVEYDNTNSWLTSVNVQDAIDEIMNEWWIKTTLDALEDTEITDPENFDVLQYDSEKAKWVNTPFWWWIIADTTGTTSECTKIWVGTMAEYEALEIKNNNTIYHIIED